MLTVDKRCIQNWRKLHAEGYFETHPHYPNWKVDEGLIIKEIEDYVGLYRNDDVLEIGCGYGRLMFSVADRVHSIIGIDIHDAPLLRAREILRTKLNARTMLTDGVSLPFEDGSFSLVYSFSSLQHMPRSIVCRYIKESRRVLRSGGRTCLQVIAAPLGRKDIDPNLVIEQSVGWTPEQLLEASLNVDMHVELSVHPSSLLLIGRIL